ncbi:kinase [Bacillus coahuilensis m2-6]|uniref:kinase-associated lipoprotein B n=1 Tax=Bacillus coahuilensis TaxID=408580 RepID=UPI0007502115|nr:kinase-associated lipoprotein B [Bacillus coahuilensis]KUP06086.1 kinase [Bacillus coahuilensis m2-6]
MGEELIVTGIYKTGKYIGKKVGEREATYTVEVLSVIKHPIQGDLHHPNQTDEGFFHERKALAYREKVNIPQKMVKPYEGEIPHYQSSLKQAFFKLEDSLKMDDTPFNIRSLQCLYEIKKSMS